MALKKLLFYISLMFQIVRSKNGHYIYLQFVENMLFPNHLFERHVLSGVVVIRSNVRVAGRRWSTLNISGRTEADVSLGKTGKTTASLVQNIRRIVLVRRRANGLACRLSPYLLRFGGGETHVGHHSDRTIFPKQRLLSVVLRLETLRLILLLAGLLLLLLLMLLLLLLLARQLLLLLLMGMCRMLLLLLLIRRVLRR